VLQARGAASQADIVRETGLSRTTVSSLVADLLEEGSVVERSDSTRQAPSRSGGRPPTLLTLDPTSGGFVGIDFGHEDVRIAVVDRSGALLIDARREMEVDHHADEALDAVVEMTPTLVAEAGLERGKVLGVGVAVSAPIRSDSGGFASRVIFPGWADVDVRDVLSSRLGLPVFVGNDANLGALAEATFGAGRGVPDILYVMLSAGVGAGLFLGSSLYEGQSGIAGELGHMVVNPDGQVCRCGNRGCLETMAGVAALTEALRHTHGPDVSLDDVIELVRAGDAGAIRVVADAGRAVGRALAGACSLLDPGLVIIGGEVAALGRVLLDSIQESIDRGTSPAMGRSYQVVLGVLGAKAEALGAAALAMHNASSDVFDGVGVP
jgi:predicted NBD/HSP70 family sugar kinase